MMWRALACAVLALFTGGHQAHAQQWVTYSSGTGFFVTRDGYVITNHHVIKDCDNITVSGSVPLSEADLVADDPDYDLALLKTNALAMAEAHLSSVKQPVQAHDRVVVLGYPGQAWQTGRPTMREANILNTKGPMGQEKWLEFSDALEQGNSGGPLLDSTGNVVGVVVAKGRLITTRVDASGQETSEEEFDLAISLPVLRRFLESNGIVYQEADSGLLYVSSGDISEGARRFVVNVRCRVR